MAVSRLNEIKNPMKNGARVQQSRPKPKSAFAEFKQQQDKINHACDQIAKSTRDIKDLIERYSRATKSSEEDEISAELDNIVQRTGKVAKECKANIQRLNDDLKKNASSYPEGSNELASRKQGIKASATKFIKRVKDYQASQELFKVNMKETLTRRVKIIAPDKDDAEIDKIIDDGEAGKIFQQVILQGKGRLADTYRDVMDTHKDILRLTRQLEQLADMFNDLNLIVERQGEQIDKIEDLINNTQDFMEKGIKQLDSAKKHQNANRKWICIMLVIAIVILIIICIPLISNAAQTA